MVLFHHAQDGSSIIRQSPKTLDADLLSSPSVTKCARLLFGDVYNSMDTTIMSAHAETEDKKRPRRNVRFTQTVKVHYVDDDGHLSTEDEEICEEPKETYRNFYLGRSRGGRIARGQRMRRSLSFPCADSPNEDYDELVNELNSNCRPDASNRLSYCGNIASDSSSIGQQNSKSATDVSITFIREASNNTLALKLVLHLGTEYKADDVLVRANMRGNVLRVVSNSKAPSTSEGDATLKQEQSTTLPLVDKRYELPVEVDPYMVRAKMDTAGNLTIEAPLMTASRTR